MTRKILFFAISLIAITLILYMPYKLRQKIQTTNIVTLKETEIRDSLSYKALIKSENSLVINLKVPVIIDKVYVKEGQQVEKGQLLFSIKTYDELKTIKGENFSNVDINSIIDYITKDLGQVKKQYENLSQYYYAKENGVVKNLSIEDNELTKPMQNLVDISSFNNLKLYLDLLPSDISKIKKDMDLTFHLPFDTQKEYVGKISNIGNVANSKLDGMKLTQYITAKGEIINKDDKLIDGLSVYTNIYIGDKYKINVLPYTAIEQDEKGEYVYVLSNNKPQKKYVKTGKEVGNLTEILDGVVKKDIVIDNASKVKVNNIIKVENEHIK